MRYVMAFTYEPKIERVRRGEISQTIRPKWKVALGDRILLHGWTGKPYRSKWSWRLSVTVSHVENIYAFADGIKIDINGAWIFFPWDSERADTIAALDGIEPPTGIALGKLLTNMHRLLPRHRYGPTDYRPNFQIIAWKRES
jgi:hypothetical protein